VIGTTLLSEVPNRLLERIADGREFGGSDRLRILCVGRLGGEGVPRAERYIDLGANDLRGCLHFFRDAPRNVLGRLPAPCVSLGEDRSQLGHGPRSVTAASDGADVLEAGREGESPRLFEPSRTPGIERTQARIGRIEVSGFEKVAVGIGRFCLYVLLLRGARREKWARGREQTREDESIGKEGRGHWTPGAILRETRGSVHSRRLTRADQTLDNGEAPRIGHIKCTRCSQSLA
jgi:hypothetical protein